MKNNLFLLIIIGTFFWTCSDDSPLSINQFSIENEDISSSIDTDNYGVNIGGETNYTLAYNDGFIRSDRIKLKLEADDDDFLNFEIYRKDEAVTELGQDWGFYGITHDPSDDNYIEHFYDSVSEPEFTYWDESLSQNSYYTYQIVTRYTNGTHHIDEMIIKTPKWEAPSNLTFTPLSLSKAEVNWEDNCDSEDNFILKIGSDQYTLSKNTTSYTINNLSTDESFNIKVHAKNSYEDNTTKAILNDNQIIFNTPTNFNVYSSDEKAYLSWEDDSNITNGYYIHRKTDNSNWSKIATISSNINEYTDEDNLSIGTTYYYRIRGYNNYNNIQTTSYTGQESAEIIQGYFFNFDNEVVPVDWTTTNINLVNNSNNGIFDSNWGIQFAGNGGDFTIPAITIPQNTDVTISFYFTAVNNVVPGFLTLNNSTVVEFCDPVGNFSNYNEYSYTYNMGINESLDISVLWTGVGQTLDMDNIRISW